MSEKSSKAQYVQVGVYVAAMAAMIFIYYRAMKDSEKTFRDSLSQVWDKAFVGRERETGNGYAGREAAESVVADHRADTESISEEF